VTAKSITGSFQAQCPFHGDRWLGLPRFLSGGIRTEVNRYDWVHCAWNGKLITLKVSQQSHPFRIVQDAFDIQQSNQLSDDLP
jgi:hypothetical protein